MFVVGKLDIWLSASTGNSYVFQNVPVSYWINPAEKLVHHALKKWQARMLKADNTSCIVALIDAQGPRKLSILKKQREENFRRKQNRHSTSPKKCSNKSPVSLPEKDNTNPSQPETSPLTWNDINECDDMVQVPKKESPPVAGRSGPQSPAALNDSLDDSVQTCPTPKSEPLSRKCVTPSPGHSQSPMVEKPPGLTRHSAVKKTPDLSCSSSLRRSVSNRSLPSANDSPNKLTKCNKLSQVLTDRQQSLANCMAETSCNLKDVQNIFNQRHNELKLKNEKKLKNLKEESQNINNSNSRSASGKSNRRIVKAKSIFKRTSLRLRRLQQKARTRSAQEENKKFLSKVVCGLKRKSISCDGPPSKKLCKS